MHPHVLSMLDGFLAHQLPPFRFVGHAAELAKVRWQPQQGILIESEVLEAAGIHRLASKHERVAFGVKRAA